MVFPKVLLLSLVFKCFTLAKKTKLTETEDFPLDTKSEVAQLLLSMQFEQFQSALQRLLGSPEADHLLLKASYLQAMHEILLTQTDQFAVLGDMLADHMLIPQCSSRSSRAFLLEYKVLMLRHYKVPLQRKLQINAEDALKKINFFKYSLFAANFHHVKEVVKIGVSFFNRTSTALVHEIEHFRNE